MSFFKKLQSNRAAKKQLQRQQLTQDTKQQIEDCNKIWIEDGKKYNYEPCLCPIDDEIISAYVDCETMTAYLYLSQLLDWVVTENQERRRLAGLTHCNPYSLKNEYEIQLKEI